MTVPKARIGPNLAGAIASLFLLATIALFMGRRHFFDDETINVYLVSTKSLTQLYRFAQSQDVHPPLSYLLNGIFYRLFGSFNSILWANAVVEAIAIYFFVRAVADRTESSLARLAVAIGTGLNPSILLWGVSLRWYSYWIPVALVVFTILFLKPRRRSTLPWVAGLMVLNFYIGYLTLALGVALFVTEWVVHGIRITKRRALALVGCASAILPQCYYLLTVHIPQGKDQSSHNLIKLIGSAGIGTLVGPLVFPISPAAVLFSIATIVVLIALAILHRRGNPKESLALLFRKLDPLILTAAVLIVLEIVSGIAIKERNLVIASLLIFSWIPVQLPSLPKLARGGYLAVWAVFLGLSARNGVGQTNTGKASVNTPIADLRKEILQDESRFGTDDAHTWIVTWDKIATCYGSLWKMKVASALVKGVEHQAESFDFPIHKGDLVILLKSEQNSWTGGSWASALRIFGQTKADIIRPRIVNLGFDRYHAFESKMTGAEFPPYQIEYYAGLARDDLNLHWQGAESGQ